MSGGHYFYKYRQIEELVQLIEEDFKDGEFEQYRFSVETIDRLKQTLKIIKMAGELAHAIEWLMSGDTSKDTFNKEFKEATDKYK